jgi:molybdenum cofactor synthesis domain-containing protein
MNAAILSIGSELMEGRIVDTNAAWIADHLTTLGFTMVRTMGVGDRRADILAVLGEVSRIAEVVIVTGGLGPTPDDPTREVFAQFCGVDLVEDALSPGLLQAGDELGSQDVDLAVEQAPLVGDLVLPARQVVDELLEVVV